MLRRVRLHHFRHRECLTVPDELTYGRALVWFLTARSTGRYNRYRPTALETRRPTLDVGEGTHDRKDPACRPRCARRPVDPGGSAAQRLPCPGHRQRAGHLSDGPEPDHE